MQDALLDGAFRDNLLHAYHARLPDAVRAVGGLLLGRGVPPGVGVDDHARAREVQARAARLERHQEHGHVVAVELVHQFHAVLLRRLPRDGIEGDACLVEALRDQAQEAGELAEDERLLAAFHGACHQFHDGIELRAVAAIVLEQQTRVAAQLAQLHEFGKHLHAGNVFACITFRLTLLALAALAGQLLAQALLVSMIELQLLALHGGVHDAFQLVGQVGEHIGLAAPEQKRPHDGAQAGGNVLFAAHDGQLEAFVEARVRPQKARHQEVEDAPQL